MSSGVSDQVRFKPAYPATEASWRLAISYIETRGFVLSRQQTTKVLIISFWRMNEIVKAIFVNCETDTIFNNEE